MGAENSFLQRRKYYEKKVIKYRCLTSNKATVYNVKKDACVRTSVYLEFPEKMGNENISKFSSSKNYKLSNSCSFNSCIKEMSVKRI